MFKKLQKQTLNQAHLVPLSKSFDCNVKSFENIKIKSTVGCTNGANVECCRTILFMFFYFDVRSFIIWAIEYV